MQRWPDAYKALQQELSLRLSTPINDHDLIRARIDVGYADDNTAYGKEFNPDFTDTEKAELIMNVRQLNPDDPLHNEVFKAVETGSLVTWEDLLDNHAKRQKRRNGQSLAPSTITKTKNAIRSILDICPYPSTLTKKLVKDMVSKYEASGKKASTTSSNLTLLQTIVNSGLKNDLLEFPINPFQQVDFKAATDRNDERKEFTTEQVRLLINDEKFGEVYRFMIATGPRIGEVVNRDLSKDIDNGMLIIRWSEDGKVRTKSKASTRRVPLDPKAEKALRDFYASGMQPDTLAKYLRKGIKNYFNDPLLVVHSCRHTFKTLARIVDMGSEYSDQISGHAKEGVNPTADGYGSYSDEILKEKCQKVYDYIDAL